MRLLALDTSTSAITVAVHDGESVVATAEEVDARRTTELLAPLVERALAEAGVAPAELTDVVVGTGPGPFTGLRVGIVTALTVAHAVGARAHGICSLDALALAYAQGDPSPGRFLVATDARRKEVYRAEYAIAAGTIDGADAGPAAFPVPGLRRLDGPAVARPADLPADLVALPTVGRGPHLYPDLLPHPAGPLDVCAAALAELGRHRIAHGLAMPVEPLYLRRPDAVASAGPKKVTAPVPAGRRQQEQARDEARTGEVPQAQQAQQ